MEDSVSIYDKKLSALESIGAVLDCNGKKDPYSVTWIVNRCGKEVILNVRDSFEVIVDGSIKFFDDLLDAIDYIRRI